MGNLYQYVLFILMACSIESLLAATNPFLMGYNTVTAKAGTIKGTKENIKAFGKTYEYFAYRGIRYGKDTSGVNRFKKPIPVDKFNGVYEAFEYTNSCSQPSHAWGVFNLTVDPLFHKRTGEDCLSLNIFSPADGGKKKAVMVWIHGGAWREGAGLLYFGGLLAPFGDVVYVSINFRLGALGFLNTDDSNSRGNFAYFDQLLALKWVKNNIEAFGGDPDAITIFGLSAGGYDVNAQAISPLSAGKGLFKRVIAQSGFAVTPLQWNSNPLSIGINSQVQARNLGFNLRCNDTTNPKLSDTKKLVDCLRKKSAAEILKYTDFGLPADAVVKEMPDFRAAVDGEFFPEHPAKLYQDPTLASYKAFKNLDFIASVTSNDGEVMFTFYQQILQKAGVKPPYPIPKTFMNNIFLPNLFPAATLPGIARAVAYEYMTDADIANNSLLRRDAFIQLQTDFAFVSGAVAAANTHEAMKGTGKTWMLYFDHNSPLYPKKYGPGKATHGADVMYAFGFVAMNDNVFKLHGSNIPTTIKQADLDLAKAQMTYFTNFAKYGNPNGKPGSSSTYPTWPQYTLPEKSYMFFGSNAKSVVLEAKKNLRPRAMAFWLDYVPFLVGQKCPTPKPCVTPTCPPLLDQYIGYLRLTVGQAQTVIVIFAVGTAIFGSLSLILLMACCKLRRNLANTSKTDD